MGIRKRCKHAAGHTGTARTRIWRGCNCVWGTDLYIDGVRVWKNLGTDEQAARIADAQLRLDMMQGRRPRHNTGNGFTGVAEEWLAVKTAAVDARANSLKVYRTRVRHAQAFFGDIPIPDIQQRHINDAAEAFTREIGAATAKNVLRCVSAIMNWASTHHGIEHPRVTFQGTVQYQPAADRTLTITEARAVVSHLTEPIRSMAEFALLTGLRRGELLALECGDYDNGRVAVTKNLDGTGAVGPPKTRTSRRLVSLSPRAQEIVVGRISVVGAGRLWPVSTQVAQRELHVALRAAGVYRRGRGWHTFRHAHTALLNESGISLRDSAARLGHGANFAQSLAYGWASEQVDAAIVDDVVKRHDAAN